MTFIGYSLSMDMTTEAPDISPGYPSKGRLLGPAWRTLWSMLCAHPDEYQDGTVLAAQAAAEHGLAPVTLRAVLTRAATAGLVVMRRQDVEISASWRGANGETVQRASTRSRVHYRPAPRP